MLNRRCELPNDGVLRFSSNQDRPPTRRQEVGAGRQEPGDRLDMRDGRILPETATIAEKAKLSSIVRVGYDLIEKRSSIRDSTPAMDRIDNELLIGQD